MQDWTYCETNLQPSCLICVKVIEDEKKERKKEEEEEEKLLNT